jgi:hypothetical protein
MAALLWINNTPYWARHTPWCVALLVTFFVTHMLSVLKRDLT